MTATVEKIFILMSQNKVTAKQVAQDTGISQSNFTEWKKGRSNPKIEATTAIAKYFNVPVEYLLGSESKNDDPNELKLIAAYRQLNDTQKQLLLSYSEFLKDRFSVDDYFEHMNVQKSPMDEIKEELQLIKESLSKKLKSDD